MLLRIVIIRPAVGWDEGLCDLVLDTFPGAEVKTCAPDCVGDAKLSCDLLLLDARLVADPRALIMSIPARVARRRIVVFRERDVEIARLAHARQFHGMLHSDATPAIQRAILRLVMEGGEYFPCFALSGEGADLPDLPSPERLSKRQRQVLMELMKGRTNKEIADRLGISLATAKLHVQAILAEAGARNRTEAVLRFGGAAPSAPN